MVGAFGFPLPGRPAEPAAPDDRFRKAPGPAQVEIVTFDWVDRQRQREVPVKIYYPKESAGPSPVIIFSHGLGGSRDGYEFLGRHWASYGYVSVHIQHKGSDTAVWRNAISPMPAMREAALDAENHRNRPRDVSFAIDQLKQLDGQESPLKGRLDLKRIGVGGHSFGAYTSLAIAGQKFITPEGEQLSFADPRVKAVIAMSPPVHRKKGQLEKVYDAIHLPCLHMTGTNDQSPIGLTIAADRRVPFDSINGAEQYLVIFKDANHMIFSDRRHRSDLHRTLSPFHDLIRMSTTAFWDAYLRDDAQAKHWLAGGGVSSALGPNGTFETKSR